MMHPVASLSKYSRHWKKQFVATLSNWHDACAKCNRDHCVAFYSIETSRTRALNVKLLWIHMGSLFAIWVLLCDGKIISVHYFPYLLRAMEKMALCKGLRERKQHWSQLNHWLIPFKETLAILTRKGCSRICLICFTTSRSLWKFLSSVGNKDS